MSQVGRPALRLLHWPALQRHEPWLTCAVWGHRLRLRWKALSNRRLQSRYETLNSSIGLFFCIRGINSGEERVRKRRSQVLLRKTCEGFHRSQASCRAQLISATLWALMTEHACPRLTTREMQWSSAPTNKCGIQATFKQQILPCQKRVSSRQAMAAHSCKPTTTEAEARGLLWVWGKPGYKA